MFKKFLIYSSIAFGLVTPTVFAGGGLISITSVSQNPVEIGQAYVVSALANKEDLTPCQKCSMRFFLEDQKSSDLISPESDKTDTNGKLMAKIYSKTAGNHVLYAILTLPNGSEYQSSAYLINYLPQPPQEPIISEPTPSIPFPQTPTTISGVPQPPYIPITQGPIIVIGPTKPISGLKNNAREVPISWNNVKGATRYEIMLRPADYSNWAIPLDSPTSNTFTTLVLSSDVDYYVRIDACNEYDYYHACISSKETLVPKSEQPQPGEITKPILGDKTVQELSNKVADLERQVAKTQEKQNFLERQINGIVKFLKSIFPFFK